ncbi:MAG: hypothetical protein HWQ35_13840 [Nostoc sp. NMS1]|uniref:hypothetical protein n=1 Tax=unclassified Nostoc TaxID=2593658 RepID=UPI0025DE64B0|nr:MULTISPECIES: hypothetical protein [unclassified Nostoc]MBN3907592.1 hypothetical protein [Nostoc sp. NMS1]MBN3994995.1 hypothetical protein [Nostoc sp. NMS2]
MAASVTTVASTLEAQLWELAIRIQQAELAITTDRPNNIQTSVDTENKLVSITFSAPAVFSVSSAGALVATPAVYLP